MLPAIYDRYITDPSKETNGVVKDFGDFVVEIKRSGGANEAFGIELAKAFAPYQQVMELNEMPEQKTRELYYDVTARTTIGRWWFKAPHPTEEGKTVNLLGLGYGDVVVNGERSVIDATPTNLVELFTKAHELWVDIKMFAERREHYLAQTRAAAAKNSAPSLPTS